MNRIIQNEPDHPVPAPKTLTSPVLLNTLPFTTPVDEVEISLSARRLPGTYPIAADALPPECNGTTALPSPPYYFMRFGEMSDEGLTLRVKLARHPEVACAWLTNQIIQ